GQHFLPRQARQLQVLFGRRADGWQGSAEGDHAIVLGPVPDLAPAGVVAVLLAAAGIPASSLDVAVVARAHPDVGPRWRDGARANAGERLRVADRLAVRA